MKSKSFVALQVFLWFICAFHVSVGIGINVSSGFPEVVAGYYGAHVDWTPQFSYILKPLGAFMFVLGIFAAAAALNPLANRVIVYGFVALFTIRALQRLIFQSEIHTVFSIAPGRNMANMVFFLAMAAALFALYRHVDRAART